MIGDSSRRFSPRCPGYRQRSVAGLNVHRGGTYKLAVGSEDAAREAEFLYAGAKREAPAARRDRPELSTSGDAVGFMPTASGLPRDSYQLVSRGSSLFIRHIGDRHELAAVRERDPGITHPDVIF